MSNRIYYSREAEEVANRQRFFVAFVSFTLGMALGTLIMLLFAPKEGEQTRKRISEALEEGFERGRTAAEDAIQNVEKDSPDLLEEIRRAIRSIGK